MKLLKRIQTKKMGKEGMIIQDLQFNNYLDTTTYLITKIIFIPDSYGHGPGDLYPSHYEAVIQELKENKLVGNKKTISLKCGYRSDSVASFKYIGKMEKIWI